MNKHSGSQAKKKKKRGPALGIVHIQTTFNNTIVTFSDVQGNVLVSSSAGKSHFKGTKKSTPYAAQVTVEAAAKEAKDIGFQTLSIHVNGAGSQREAALRAMFNQPFVITQIVDTSKLPHNGTRPPKRRRN
ncbi:30S ribosomal protein S11 [Candidatus Sneabacter namystus]|uniref:Small ribosomal subunit protein uS11 n=1 Tax=Candidatus Sneabacter namystus TaxID=2601646 RepID=A0A5C0UJ62_9RICK|nr:30S ribosomal protein S11 [Candidatus Sneabacter namystus]QEK39502.1 30S ribosomal protein S11 [Candidatus Sneabacter namystus]